MRTVREVAAMRRAIALSAFGLGSTSPNPPVGCVILDDTGTVVGTGYHRRKGEAHAEVHALTAAGPRARGGTAVVTLEPCNHHGRTPPCHQALIDAGIRRVVVAVIDPTSRGEGGVARLRQAGLDVTVGVLADEAVLVLGSWLTSLWTRRPYVVRAGVYGPPDRQVEADLSRLCAAVDVIVDADRTIREAVAGNHLPGTLTLAGLSLDETPDGLASSMFEGGIRRVLIAAPSGIADAFVRDGMVDRSVLYIPVERMEPGSTPTMADLVPEQAVVRSYTPIGGYVRIDLAHPRPEAVL